MLLLLFSIKQNISGLLEELHDHSPPVDNRCQCPRFCAAANLFDSLFLELGAGPRIAPTGKADAAGYEERAVWDWASEVLEASSAGRLALIDSAAHVAALSRIPINGSAAEVSAFMYTAFI